MQWSRNDIHIGGAKRGVVNCFITLVSSHKIIYQQVQSKSNVVLAFISYLLSRRTQMRNQD